MVSVPAELYPLGCHGKAKHTSITKVLKEDAEFIKQNNLILSIEELSYGDFACYIRRFDQDEDEEVLCLADGRNCEDTIHELLNMYKSQEGARC